MTKSKHAPGNFKGRVTGERYKGGSRCAVCMTQIKSGRLCARHQDEAEKLSPQGKFRIEAVKLVDLTVDPAYQRPINEAKVRKILRTFDPEAVGLLKVSRRKDGGQYLIDGQHRWLVLAERGDEKATCQVFEGLTPKDEARIWTKGNDNLKPHVLDNWHARVAGGELVAAAITRILDAGGYRIGRTATAEIQAVTAIEAIYSWGPGVLAEAVALHKALFEQRSPGWLGRDIWMGVGLFVKAFSGRYRTNLLVRHMAEIQPGTLVARAQAMSDFAVGQRTRAYVHVAELIRQHYNRGLKDEGRLPEMVVEISSGQHIGQLRVAG